MNCTGTRVDQRPRRGTRWPYRRHTIELKRAVVEQSRQPGASVSRLAHPHDINAKQIFAWRKGQHEGRLGVAAFVPIIRTETDGLDAPEMLDAPAAAFGRLTIEARAHGSPSKEVSTARPSAASCCATAATSVPHYGKRICTAAGIIDMRRGFDGLAALAQTPFETDPFSGHIVAFNRVSGPSAETGSGCCGGMATDSRGMRACTGAL